MKARLAMMQYWIVTMQYRSPMVQSHREKAKTVVLLPHHINKLPQKVHHLLGQFCYLLSNTSLI